MICYVNRSGIIHTKSYGNAGYCGINVRQVPSIFVDGWSGWDCHLDSDKSAISPEKESDNISASIWF